MELKARSRYKVLYKISGLISMEFTSRLCKEGATRELAVTGYYKHSLIGKNIRTCGFSIYFEVSIFYLGFINYFVPICFNLESAVEDINTNDLDFWLDVDDYCFRLQFVKAELVEEPLTANLPQIVVRGEDKSILEPERYAREEPRLPPEPKKPTGAPNIPEELVPKKTFTFPLPPLTYEEEVKKSYLWLWLLLGAVSTGTIIALIKRKK